VTQATLHDNPYTSPIFRRRIEAAYGGTRLGRQEIGGEFLEDVEGAAWARHWIERARVREAPELARIVVAVDPAASARPTSDFTGLAVAGKSWDGDYYVLHALGYRLAPAAWAARAVDLYDQYQADRIVAEVNNGGDMVMQNIATVPHDAGYVPVTAIHASRGKLLRADPVLSLYEQGHVHHVGMLAEAEDQMCSWPVEAEHDDIVDALVYALTDLMATQAPGSFADLDGYTLDPFGPAVGFRSL
jgi:predicted phage terminase large subunit-like protein